MGDPQYRSTQGALAFDAYYVDEFGAVNDAANCAADASARQGFHKSTFTFTATSNGSVSESHQSLRWTFTNVADARSNPSLRERSNAVPASAPTRFGLSAFFSDSVQSYAHEHRDEGWDTPIELTLFYGVGHELNRHGLRSFFKHHAGLRGIVLLPGIEPKKGEPRFGVAIDDRQLAQMLRDHFGKPVPYVVRVLASFSTGSCGLNQTLLNDLLRVRDVRRLVVFDCLYSLNSGNTAEAIKRLKRAAGGDLRIVVYKTSEGGNSFLAGTSRLAVVEGNPRLIDSRGIIENLYQNPRYISLVVFRCLDAAVRDGVVAIAPERRRAYGDMAALLASTARGSMISNRTAFDYVHGAVPQSPPYTHFEAWSQGNRKVIDAFSAQLGKVSVGGSLRNLLWGFQLPGWPGGDGEEKHDLLLPEFGWEYLPG